MFSAVFLLNLSIEEVDADGLRIVAVEGAAAVVLDAQFYALPAHILHLPFHQPLHEYAACSRIQAALTL